MAEAMDAEAMDTDEMIVADVACTMCGCVCDDLAVSLKESERGIEVVAAKNACCLAEPWFLGQGTVAPLSENDSAFVDGRPTDFRAAINAAVDTLSKSNALLVYGLSRSSTPGQRAAVRLADKLGASIDTTASTCHAPSIMALQQSGESTCSLGEIRNRSDLVVYWGSNPLVSHPRHVEQYVDAKGMFVGGRAERHLVVVDVEPTETSEQADTFIQIERGRDLELMTALRLILSGRELQDEEVAGLNHDEIIKFAELLKTANYGAVFFGLGITRTNVPHATVESLLRLTSELNQHTRFVVRRMRIPGDVAGADSVLCWQTGFPFSVNLSRGYPRYNPGEYTAENLLARKEVDAAVLVGAEGVEKLSTAAREQLNSIPTILLEYPSAETEIDPAVRFTTAIYGIHRQGTAYRMDEVPIPLKGFLKSDLPSDEDVLVAILEQLK